MPQKPLDVASLVRVLSEGEVVWVLIGRMAMILHGGGESTEDVDAAIAFSDDNRQRLVSALAPLHPRPIRLAEGAAWVWDEKCVRFPWTILQTDAGRLDLIITLPGIDSFQGLLERSVVRELFGYKIRVASIDDLITMKSNSDRPKDAYDVLTLKALKRLQTETE